MDQMTHIFFSSVLIWLMLAAIVYEIGHRGVAPWFLVFLGDGDAWESAKILSSAIQIEDCPLSTLNP